MSNLFKYTMKTYLFFNISLAHCILLLLFSYQNFVLGNENTPIRLDDTVAKIDDQLSLPNDAVELIIQSKTTQGIPLLLDYLENADPYSDSAVYAKLFLVEAYRKLKDFEKGFSLVFEILNMQNISQYNRAFACNRLAALYTEGGGLLTDNNFDSTIRYSERCIEISEVNGFTDHLATSQNELAFVYLHQDKLKLALDYGLSAVDNFISANMPLHAMNASINVGNIYMAMNQYRKAADSYRNALKLSNVEESKVLHMRIYIHLSNACFSLGEYRAAYEYQKTAREMQGVLQRELIEAQIYEMTAKYDLKEKEIKILEEQQKARIYSQQKQFLFIIALILLMMISVLLVFFRIKSIAYRNLVQKNLELARCDKKTFEHGNIFPELDVNEDTDEEGMKTEMQLIDRFNKYFLEEKPYLFSHISLEDVAIALETNRTYLSKAINTAYSKSFSALVNELRIREARQFLINKKYNHISTEGIGQMVGYNSRNVFYSNFKKHTGLTPSYFKKSVSHS